MTDQKEENVLNIDHTNIFYSIILVTYHSVAYYVPMYQISIESNIFTKLQSANIMHIIWSFNMQFNAKFISHINSVL